MGKNTQKNTRENTQKIKFMGNYRDKIQDKTSGNE
jgi:hypothetical protein